MKFRFVRSPSYNFYNLQISYRYLSNRNRLCKDLGISNYRSVESNERNQNRDMRWLLILLVSSYRPFVVNSEFQWFQYRIVILILEVLSTVTKLWRIADQRLLFPILFRPENLNYSIRLKISWDFHHQNKF